MAKGQESMVIQSACLRPRQATWFRPRQAGYDVWWKRASGWQRHWVLCAPAVDSLCVRLGVHYAEDAAVAPARCEFLPAECGVASPEPVAEHAR